jgi:hypothetical protein
VSFLLVRFRASYSKCIGLSLVFKPVVRPELGESGKLRMSIVATDIEAGQNRVVELPYCVLDLIPRILIWLKDR